MYWLIGLLRNLISQTDLEFENSKSCGRRQSGSAQPHSFEHRLSSNAIASLELLKPTQRFMKLHTINQDIYLGFFLSRYYSLLSDPIETIRFHLISMQATNSIDRLVWKITGS